MSSIMDPSHGEEKAVSSHVNDHVNSYDKEGSPLNDEIFDILFPASPEAEETIEKDDSHIELNKHERGPGDIKQENNTQLTNVKTKLNENLESSKKEITDQSQYSISRSEDKYAGNKNEILKSTDTISSSKEKLSSKNFYHSSNDDLEGMLPVAEMEPIFPIDDELYFDFSDTSLSDDENEKSFNKSKVSVSDFLVLDEVNERKQSSQYSNEGMMLKIEKGKKIEMKNKSEYPNKGKDKDTISKDKIISNKDVKIIKNCSSKTKFTSGNKAVRTENNGKAFKNAINKIIPMETKISAQIGKNSPKKNYVLEDVIDREEAIELEPQHSDILDDISDDEMLENSDIKKKNNVLQDFNDRRAQKREWANEESNKKMSAGQPAMKIDEPLQNKYDEIIIIGDERLPTLTKYKNVKIIREEGLELRNLKSFIKKCGLHHDISSKPALRRMILLCVGLNDIILKTVSRDCSDMRRKKDKTHKPCFLFRHPSVRFDLLTHIKGQVEEISEFLPPTCDVIFDNLYMFDLDMINENLSLEHHSKYGHHAVLSESDVHNNQKVKKMIQKVNDHIARKRFILNGINCISKYQEKYKVNFMTEVKKTMVFNIKEIQRSHSKQHGDERSLLDKNVGKDDLRWVLNKMNKGEVHSLREELQSGTSKKLKTEKNYANFKDISEKKGSNVDTMDGHTRNGWHSPERCISPAGWHPAELCRQKEQERRKFHMKEKNMKIFNEKSRSPGRKRCDLNEEENLRNSNRIERERRIYERTESSRERELRELQSPLSLLRTNMAKEKMEENKLRELKTKTAKEKVERNELREHRTKMAKEKMEGRSRNSRNSEKANEKVERNELREHRTKIAKEKKERSSRNSRSSEKSMPRSKEKSIKRQNSQNYEVLKKESPTHFDRHSQKSRSSSKTMVQEHDSATSEALRNLAEVHDRSCQMYIDNPTAHPDYNKEYYVFYEAKSQKIREIGGDPREYDFMPEWKYVWEIRSQELFREVWLNMKNQCIKMVEEKKRAQEKKNTHKERIIQEEHSDYTKSSKRKRSSEKREPEYIKSKINEKCNSSWHIEKKQKYEKKELPNTERNINIMTGKSQLEALIEEELKENGKSNSTIETERSSIHSRILGEGLRASKETTFDCRRSLEIASPFQEENEMDDLCLEEVGESVMPFNLGKYVPESKECEEATIETSGSSENVLEILMMLTKLGDRMGSLGIPIKILFDRASKEKMKNQSTINIFTDPDMTLVMQLISNKLIIAIEKEGNSDIEKVIYQEVKNRVDGLLKVVEETFVEGLNVQHIAEKSLGMESSEIINCIKSGLEISTSCSFSEVKLMKIFKAVKEKQFRYLESHSKINKSSGIFERAFPMQTAKTNVNEIKISQTEIPFKLPTRRKSNNKEKYDPFEEKYV